MTRLAPMATNTCACDLGRLSLAFDHLGPEVVVHLACIGVHGRRSCGWSGPAMSVAEADVFADLARARTLIQAPEPQRLLAS